MIIFGILLLMAGLFMSIAYIADHQWKASCVCLFFMIMGGFGIGIDHHRASSANLIKTEVVITDTFQEMKITKPMKISKFEKDCSKFFLTRDSYTYYLVEDYKEK